MVADQVPGPTYESKGRRGRAPRRFFLAGVASSLAVQAALDFDYAQSLSNHWQLHRPPPQALFRRRRPSRLKKSKMSLTPGEGVTSAMERDDNDEDAMDADDEDDDEFCQIVDAFGCEAFEKFRQSESDNELQWIRLEKERDQSILNITNPDDVLRRIEDAKREQGRVGPCALYSRRWHSAPESDEPINGVDRDSERDFSVMQFNALAEGLSCGPSAKTPFVVKSRDPKVKSESEKASFGGFSSIPFPKVALDFRLRRWRILEVILGSNRDALFDIVAMEEIDRYHGFFFPLLRLFGYQGSFVPKTRAPGLFMGWYSDGCALFWQPSFELVSEQRREYSVGNQVYMIVTLRHVATGHHVIVAVTHLKAQKGAAQERVRCHQVDELLDSISKRASVLVQNHKAVSVIVTGDFNADPPVNTSDDGAVSRILRRGIQTNAQHSSSPILSAYDLSAPTFYTTWKTRGPVTIRRIIDYIFYSGSLTCKATLRVPPEVELDVTKLPGLRYPSDHVMIAAKFRIEPN